MSTADTEPVEQAENTAGEEGGPSERAARLILALVALLAVWGIVAAFPDLAYIVVGILLTRGWDKARAWRAARQTAPAAEDEQPDVGAALRRLIGDDKGVLLTVLRDDLNLPDTKAVKALLEAEDIPWKPSRTQKGNGPAVRKEAIPAAPSAAVADSHGEGCCCRPGDNGNTNNDEPPGAGEGLRVERIGVSGKIVYHPSDTHRRHRVGDR